MGRILMRGLMGLLILVLLSTAAATLWLRSSDHYESAGSLPLAGLEAPVQVMRDQQGVPYLFAQSIEDAIRAQGWVTAQDRLLQIEFERYLANGRLAELIGKPGLKSDISVRLAGIPRHGQRHASLLGAADRRFYELYLQGLNEYIATRREEHQFGFALLGIDPQPWTLADVMSLQYFLNWSSSVNLRAELLSQALADRLGPERALELAQLTVNPDDGSSAGGAGPRAMAGLGLAYTGWPEVVRPYEVGSNQWVMSGRRSVNGAPVLVNDPHIDSRTLPGIWHPVGLITPGFRAVGVAGPGIPGLAVGRTTHVAFGVTNAYADVIDLFVETEDPERPGHYLEGNRSYPFTVVEETLRVRARPGSADFTEVPLRIRYTHRGPVISDHGPEVATGRLLSMRWSSPEDMQPDTGAFALFTARSVEAARAAIGRNTAPWNYVVADTAGNIAHVTAGRVPIRRRGDGSVPLAVTEGTDDWNGFIPWDRMPGQVNPDRGWAGNANHRTVPGTYPWPYSTYFAASWRYRRMQALLDGSQPLAASDHWGFMRDTHNTMADVIAPVMARALLAEEDTRTLGQVLADWNHQDDPALAAPAIFQSVYRHFALAVFGDELGPELAGEYLSTWYYWQERLAALVTDGTSAWFDDTRTPARETRDELFRAAARAAQAELTALMGPDTDTWRWGRVHTVTFFSPLLPGQTAAGWLGAGTHPKAGSGETLNRAIYAFDAPYTTVTIASLRFVADLADPDRVMGVVSGGASGRQFDAHLGDQIEPWLNGEPRYWWFSDDAIRRNAVTELRLTP